MESREGQGGGQAASIELDVCAQLFKLTGRNGRHAGPTSPCAEGVRVCLPSQMTSGSSAFLLSNGTQGTNT